METDKYIVLLETQEKTAIRKVEKELQLSVTSSEVLSTDNRSFEIIDENNGVLYKNLNVLVLDHMDAAQLRAAVKNDNNPIIYFEKERKFFPAGQAEIIADLKQALD